MTVMVTKIILDPSKENNILEGFYLIETEIDFLRHDSQEKYLWLSGKRLCNWVEKVLQVRGLLESIDYKILNFPKEKLYNIFGIYVEKINQEKLKLIYQYLDQSKHPTLGGFLSYITGNDFWNEIPSLEHAAKWLLIDIEKDVEKDWFAFAEKKRQDYLEKCQDQPFSFLYNKVNPLEKSNSLKAWLCLDDNFVPLGYFPLKATGNTEKLLKVEWERLLRETKGLAIEKLFPQNSPENPNTSLIAQIAYEYLVKHPAYIKKTFLPYIGHKLALFEKHYLEQLVDKKLLTEQNRPKQIFYRERADLISKLDSLHKKWFGTDEQLIVQVEKKLKNIVFDLGFKNFLVRDIAVLSQFLLQQKNDSILLTNARNVLIYCLQAEECEEIKILFTTNYVVNKIYKETEIEPTYGLPKINHIDQEHIKQILNNSTNDSAISDSKLINYSKKLKSEIENFVNCPLLWRMKENIDFLISTFESSSNGTKQTNYAHSILNYLAGNKYSSNNSVIMKYINDSQVLQIAVSAIEPKHQPWLDLLDETIKFSSFLNQLIIDDGASRRSLSEYMIINFALCSTKVRQNKDISTTLLITPVIGPTPFLLGFILAIELVSESIEEITEGAFKVRQPVIIDYDSVAQFAGFTTLHGEKFVKLKPYQFKQEACNLPDWYWQFSDLFRLSPIDSVELIEEVFSKEESIDKLKNKKLHALDYVFKTGSMSGIVNAEKQVLVVTSVTFARKLASSLTLFGYALQDVIPMGSITSEKVSGWSTHFGKQKLLLTFVSDLDFACELAENNIDKIKNIVIDFSERNVNKTASLQRIRQLGIPTMILLQEQEVNKLHLEDYETIWQWGEEDLVSLLWPKYSSTDNLGLIGCYENHLHSDSSAIVVKCISFPLIEEVFESISCFNDLAKERKENTLVELIDILSLIDKTFKLMQHLVIEVDEKLTSVQLIRENLAKIKAIRTHTRFLSEIEQAACLKIETLLEQLFTELRKCNPKASIVKDILLANANSFIICPQKELQNDLEQHCPVKVPIISRITDKDENFLNVAIITGWSYKKHMYKMLVPPIASPLFLVLYDFEYEWYKYFERGRKKNYLDRLNKTKRENIFPSIQNWKKPINIEATQSQDIKQDKIFKEREAIQNQIQVFHKQNLYKDSKSSRVEDNTEAYLVEFENDDYAFLTSSYKASVVTHLLDNSFEEETSIKQYTVRELKIGDALLFHRGSSRDVIRTVADQILPAGVRDRSSLWQKALQQYAKTVTFEKLCRQLKVEGCSVIDSTIKLWLESDQIIAPKKEQEHIEIIAKVTNDIKLLTSLKQVISAVHEVRSAHLKASKELADQVRNKAANILKSGHNSFGSIEIDKNVVLVQVSEINNEELVTVKKSLVNRLQEYKS